MTSRTRKFFAGILMLAVVAAVYATPASAQNTKTLGGNVMCSGTAKIYKIWFKGAQSGWHGIDFPDDRLPYVAKYAFTAVKKEKVQTWVTCGSREAEAYYTEFKVGSGSKRHICAWGGLQICTSVKAGKCAALGGTNLVSLVACLAIKAV